MYPIPDVGAVVCVGIVNITEYGPDPLGADTLDAVYEFVVVIETSLSSLN